MRKFGKGAFPRKFPNNEPLAYNSSKNPIKPGTMMAEVYKLAITDVISIIKMVN